MSIVSVNVEPEANEEMAYKFCKEFVRVTTDPLSDHLPKEPTYNIEPCFLPKKFETIANRVLNFNVRPDDIWLLGFPKTGTNWTGNILWLLANGLDYDTDKKVVLQERVFSLEQSSYFEMFGDDIQNDKTKGFFNLVDHQLNIIDALPSPRLIKSHLPIHLLPRNLWTISPKLVYVTRNPKDTFLSGFYHYRNIFGYTGSWETFLSNALKENGIFMPMYSHVTNFWKIRHLKNLFFLTYEDLSANTFFFTKQISGFLGCKYTDKELLELCQHVSFKNMRGNKFTNFEAHLESLRNALNLPATPSFRFLRKGMVGGYRSELSLEDIKRIDDMVSEKMKYSDFKFADV